ncbi:SPFH domain-containing protein [Lysobacter sp. Hz 25]|uniref:SPFH domain-containing protein n=1 Tax=Lysobacter sp. Hz 25 TaxID=3383698 RepID=UPI0038D4B9C4
MKISRILIAALLACALVACSKVPAGNVGIKAYLLGTNKGVDVEQLGPGRYWIGWNEELYLFPTYTQNYTWAKDCQEGDCANEEIGFQTVEGLAVKADVGISYHVRPDKAAVIFQKYRKGVDEITDLYLRNMVRDSLVKNASSMRVESVYGGGKATLIDKVQKDVAAQVAAIGIDVEKIYWIGELRLPAVVAESINAKIKATQMAEQRRNEVEQSKAEADKAVEAARGEATAKLEVARADAEAISIKGRAIAENPRVLELEAIQRWDGKLPQVNGSSAVPFINVNK